MVEVPRLIADPKLPRQGTGARAGPVNLGGGAIGKAAQQFGNELTGFAATLLEIEDEKQARRDRFAGARGLAEIRAELTERIGELGANAPEGAPGFKEEADKLIKKIIEERGQELPEDALAVIAPRLERLGGQFLENAIKFEVKSRNRKELRDIGAAVDLQINTIRSDPAQLNDALVEAEATIAGSALPGDAKAELRRATRERAARSAVETLNERDPKFAKSLLDGGALDKLIRPETKSALINNNQVELRRLDAKRRAMRAEAEALVAIRVRDAVFVLERGRNPPGLAALQEAAGPFPKIARALDEALQDSDRLGEFLRLPPLDQQARIQELGNKDELSRREVRRLEAMARIHAGALKGIEQDPLAYAASIDVIEGLEKLEFSDPDTLATRQAQAQVAAAFFRVPVSPLRPAEAAALTQALDTAEGDDLAALFQSLTFGFGCDNLDRIADQIAPKRPAIAVALARAEESPLVASIIVRGDRLARKNPDVKPGAADRETVVSDIYGGGLFREVPSALRPHVEAAVAIYAARRVAGGDLSFDPGLFEDALKLAAGGREDADSRLTGGPIEFNGQALLPPVPGMGDDEFADLVESLTPDDLVVFGGGQPVFTDGAAFTPELFEGGLLRRGAQLLTVGPGRYRVFTPGLGYVVTAAGAPYELDLRALAMVRGTDAAVVGELLKPLSVVGELLKPLSVEAEREVTVAGPRQTESPVVSRGEREPVETATGRAGARLLVRKRKAR